MNSVEKKIANINPRYHSNYQELIERFSQFGGGASDARYSKGKHFSSVYQFYVFAFFLGLRKNLDYVFTEGDKTSTFWELKNWKPDELVHNLLAHSIAETNFDMVGVQDYDDSEIDLEVKKLRLFIESKANGGFTYIHDLLESDESLADDDRIMLNLLSH
jgi:hypothetical protein